MARLPDLITEELKVDWDEGYQSSVKTLFSALGNLVRTSEAKEKLKKIKEGEKDES